METEYTSANPFSSMTNIVLFVLTIAMVVLVWFNRIDPNIFETSIALVLGYFFTKGGHKDGEQAAIRSAQATSAATLETIVENSKTKGNG